MTTAIELRLQIMKEDLLLGIHKAFDLKEKEAAEVISQAVKDFDYITEIKDNVNKYLKTAIESSIQSSIQDYYGYGRDGRVLIDKMVKKMFKDIQEES